MGQHKHNPNCQLAKEGKLPPKRRRKGKREAERELYAMCAGYICKRFFATAAMMQEEEDHEKD